MTLGRDEPRSLRGIREGGDAAGLVGGVGANGGRGCAAREVRALRRASPSRQPERSTTARRA